ncbi:protoglobin domain-containing protein [Pseudoclavibacter soli]|uniref:protoglobin domain-containing protein n=1 Tax=Pseudoclavibacter soli TaxID=452623 RepID=UPI0004171441|nr:protoglobin domain-containing protein [Pseudoclavibacter soli]
MSSEGSNQPHDSFDVELVARTAREQMPPGTSFTEHDADVLRDYKDFLYSLGPLLLHKFYDTLYAYPPTAAIFKAGERAARERTLADWWERTVNGPLTDSYFNWMAMVGLVHVLRGVTNPMMLSMGDHVAEVVAQQADEQLSEADADRLNASFGRLMSTVSAVIAHGYDVATEAALFDVAGMPMALLHRLRDQEISQALVRVRGEIGPQIQS